MSCMKFINGENKSFKDLAETGNYIKTPYKTENGKNLIGFGCSNDNFINEMIAIKKIFHKCTGRQFFSSYYLCYSCRKQPYT